MVSSLWPSGLFQGLGHFGLLEGSHKQHDDLISALISLFIMIKNLRRKVIDIIDINRA